MAEQTEQLLTGGCHCGAVRFEVMIEEKPQLLSCNCSMCKKTGFIHLIVGRDQFRLLKGEDMLENYRFNTGTASHLFCKNCGVKSFYIPRSHPDGFSIHAGCLDDFDLSAHTTKPFDGANWEANIGTLKQD